MDLVLLALALVMVLSLEWWALVKPLKEKVWALQKVIELDSAQRMERVLRLESYLRLEKETVRELQSELKWKTAKVLALESDLERVQSKLMWKE